MSRTAKSTQHLSFDGALGEDIRARLDLPNGPIRATAIFAHCFTCSKDIFAARQIASGLAARGFAVLRFDFTGLGGSEGDFADTNFSTNIDDLVAAANALREALSGPRLLVGHSLGGAAVLAAASRIPEVEAIATIGAPADVNHIEKSFGCHLDAIEENGEAEVSLAGRPFTIKKQFLDDLDRHELKDIVADLKIPLMVMHSPIDDTVGIDNASELFIAAKHPKSFVSLDTADHLLSDRRDAVYAADVIAAWASRFIPSGTIASQDVQEGALSSETGLGRFQNFVRTGHHTLMADEPKSVGGLDSGPSPYDYLSTALAACTTMTLRMYADRKKMAIEHIETAVVHNKVHAADCVECGGDDSGEKSNRVDRFTRRIVIRGDIADEQRQSLLAIADRCPVHQTLEAGGFVVTELVKDEG